MKKSTKRRMKIMLKTTKKMLDSCSDKEIISHLDKIKMIIKRQQNEEKFVSAFSGNIVGPQPSNRNLEVRENEYY